MFRRVRLLGTFLASTLPLNRPQRRQRPVEAPLDARRIPRHLRAEAPQRLDDPPYGLAREECLEHSRVDHVEPPHPPGAHNDLFGEELLGGSLGAEISLEGVREGLELLGILSWDDGALGEDAVLAGVEAGDSLALFGAGAGRELSVLAVGGELGRSGHHLIEMIAYIESPRDVRFDVIYIRVLTTNGPGGIQIASFKMAHWYRADTRAVSGLSWRNSSTARRTPGQFFQS